MAARNRLPPWHESIRLPNGRDVLIRPIRPEDAGPLKASFALLEPDEIRNRYKIDVLDLLRALAKGDVQLGVDDAGAELGGDGDGVMFVNAKNRIFARDKQN